MHSCNESVLNIKERYIVKFNNLIGYAKVNDRYNNKTDKVYRTLLRASAGVTIYIDLVMDEFIFKQEINPMLIDVEMEKLQIFLFEPDYNFLIKLL